MGKQLLRAFLFCVLFLVGPLRAIDFSFELTSGWNLVSVPILPDDSTVSGVFPREETGVVSVWAWDGRTYQVPSAIEPGVAYWVYRSPSAGRAPDARTSWTVSGTPAADVRQVLRRGWSLKGAISPPPYPDLALPLQTDPAGAVTAPVWTWDTSRYTELAALPAGLGCWILAREDCLVLLGPSPVFEGLVVDVSAGPEATSYPVTYLEAVPEPLSDVYRTTKILLRRVPAGTFMMGSPTNELGRSNGHERQHQVTLSKPSYIGLLEITQRQWERVMGTWPSQFSDLTVREKRPVEKVSYSAIRGASAGAGWPASNAVDPGSFLGRLGAKTGLALDLPTEALWEYACRAGTTQALNSDQDLDDATVSARVALLGRYWYNGGSEYRTDPVNGGTAPVVSYAPNAWGLYDCHGNVWEWCLDWWTSADFSSEPVTDPPGPASGDSRVIRGGAWNSLAGGCRSASRVGFGPASVGADVGFRLAAPVPLGGR